MLKSFFCLLAGALLTACAVGPNYHRPDLRTPEQYRFAAAEANEASFGDLHWWDLYQDPQLHELIRAALADNEDVRIAAARIKEARALLGASRLTLFPTVSVGVEAQRAKASIEEIQPGFPRTVSQFGAEADVAYEIDLWGRLRRSTEAARAELLATGYAKRAVLVSLVGDVATTYFDLMTLHRQLEISRRTVETRLRLVQITHERHDRGIISGLDVAATEAQLALARAAIPQQELGIARAESRLSVLLGRYPQAFSVPAEDHFAALAVPPAGLPSSLLERRPDLREAESSLVAANARVGAAKALLFPSLTLTGAFGTLSRDFSNLFTPAGAIWSASTALVQPLLDPNRSVYQRRAAAARREQALLNYVATVHRAFAEVADSLMAQTKQREIEAAQTDQVDALRRATSIAKARYDAGTASYVDVTNADRDLFDAELSLASAHRDRLVSIVTLYRALGGGWQAQP